MTSPTVSVSPVLNIPQLVGSLDGTTFFTTYNWSDHFDRHTIKTTLKGITPMHHFKFISSHPGTVFVKLASSGVEWKINLLKDISWAPSAHQLPPVIAHRTFCCASAILNFALLKRGQCMSETYLENCV